MQTQNRELILLVDDDPGNLKRAQTILGEEFRISATTSGKMALALLSKVTPDLILLDVNMPEMNGFETLTKIRELENGAAIPVVFLTGEMMRKQRQNVLKQGRWILSENHSSHRY